MLEIAIISLASLEPLSHHDLFCRDSLTRRNRRTAHGEQQEIYLYFSRSPRTLREKVLNRFWHHLHGSLNRPRPRAEMSEPCPLDCDLQRYPKWPYGDGVDGLFAKAVSASTTRKLILRWVAVGNVAMRKRTVVVDHTQCSSTNQVE